MICNKTHLEENVSALTEFRTNFPFIMVFQRFIDLCGMMYMQPMKTLTPGKKRSDFSSNLQYFFTLAKS